MTSQFEASIPYNRTPLGTRDDIPIYSPVDFYVDNYEKIAADHVSAMFAESQNPFIEEELWKELEDTTRGLIEKYIAPASVILDAGVGLGRLVGPLDQYTRYGIDISLQYLKIARERGINVAMARIEDLPFSDDSFDAVIVCDVLEHVLDLSLCTMKLLSVLRPGGTLVVRVPYKEDLSVYLRDDLPYEYIHLRSFDLSGLRLHFEKIFRLNYVDSVIDAPYLQGSARLKLRLLPEEARAKVSKIVSRSNKFSPIRDAFKVSDEQLCSWLYEIKGRDRGLYNTIAPHLIMGMDVNCVFQKPL
jgi:SAM-dependent methyltransferase